MSAMTRSVGAVRGRKKAAAGIPHGIGARIAGPDQFADSNIFPQIWAERSQKCYALARARCTCSMPPAWNLG